MPFVFVVAACLPFLVPKRSSSALPSLNNISSKVGCAIVTRENAPWSHINAVLKIKIVIAAIGSFRFGL